MQINKQLQGNKDRLELVQPLVFMNQTSSTSFGKHNSVSSTRGYHKFSPDKQSENLNSEMFATTRIDDRSRMQRLQVIRTANRSKEPSTKKSKINVTDNTLP
jgi:hypothetical protein